jgi:hypothetical protein
MGLFSLPSPVLSARALPFLSQPRCCSCARVQPTNLSTGCLVWLWFSDRSQSSAPCVFLMLQGRWAESPESGAGPSAGPENDRDVKLNRTKGEAHSGEDVSYPGKDMAEEHLSPGNCGQAGGWSAGLMEETSPLGPGKVRDVCEVRGGLRDVCEVRGGAASNVLLGPGKVKSPRHCRRDRKSTRE